MGANDHQVGGKHYKTSYEHWDLVLNVGLSYLEGCATKYVVRWRAKNGLEDLQKALHYLNKLQETGQPQPRKLPFSGITIEVSKFNRANNVDSLEGAFIAALCTWQQPHELDEARSYLLQLFDVAEAERSLPDPVPVPLTEENHYAERSGVTDGN